MESFPKAGDLGVDRPGSSILNEQRSVAAISPAASTEGELSTGANGTNDRPDKPPVECEDVLVKAPADLRIWAQRNGYAPVQLSDTKGSFVEFPVKGSIGGPIVHLAGGRPNRDAALG